MTPTAKERAGTGLDYLQRMISGELPGVPLGDTLGFRVTEVENGRIVLRGNPDQRSYNVVGTVHGGWAASILDSAMALSTLSSLDEKTAFTTLDIRINYLRPITMELGKLLAHGTGTCLILAR